MIKILRLIIIFLVIASWPKMGEATSQQEQVFAVSALTASDLVTDYFTNKGYQIKQSFSEGGRIHLLAVNGGEEWEVMVEPHTSLGANVRLLRHSGSEVLTEESKSFWQALAGRLKGELAQHNDMKSSAEPSVPEAVQANASAVVCVRVLSAGRHIQFTGFVIDSGGLVLCTAHDLRAHEEVRVIFATGVDYLGEIIKLDIHRDLALIRIRSTLKFPISLFAERSLLEMGDSIYTIGCPEPLIGVVYEGVVDSPPRKADNLVLYQVNITIKPGSSGSPVFDTSGRLVAMVKGRYRSMENIGFLIPLPTIIDFLDDLIKQH
ncbi:MAG: serine protease [Desulfobulbaceae bacterium]|nr:serine protease [Desulfobulbaceae bacterium]